MFEIIASFVSRIIAIDTEYSKEIENIEAAEKEALDKIKAEEAKLRSEYRAKMEAIKVNYKKAALKSNYTTSPEAKAALRKTAELTARFEALVAKHGH